MTHLAEIKKRFDTEGWEQQTEREREQERGVQVICCSCFFITMEITDHSKKFQ